VPPACNFVRWVEGALTPRRWDAFALRTWGLWAGLFAAGSVEGAAFQIESRTEAQAYQIRAYRETNPDAPVLLPRRRVVQYLGLNIFEIVTGEDLGFESNLRIYNDFGMSAGDARLLDGPKVLDGDLLYAYLRYRKGRFEAQVGRQLYIDVMDIMAFDGARVRYALPLGIGAEAYGGLWVKGASFLGSSVYQPDGTRETDARRLALGATSASAILDDFQPVFGGKLFMQDVFGFGASAAYRRSFVAGKTDLERLALELSYGRGRGFNVGAGAEYDLFFLRVSQLRAMARYDHDLFAISAEAMRFSTVFSADSIWYYFASAPRDEVRVRADWTPVGAFRFYGQLAVSRYNVEINNAIALSSALTDPTMPSPLVFGPSVGGAARSRDFRVALDVTLRNGLGGNQLWMDLNGGYAPDSRPYSLEGRISFANVKDTQNPLLQGSFFGAQLWTSIAMTRAARLSVMMEQNVNPFTRSETKLFLLFDLKATL
jgi:hypothetical protein